MQKSIIYNSDCKKDYRLIQFYNLTETYIQQYCRKIFYNTLISYGKQELGLFQQNDNGAEGTVGNKRRKKAEGTIAGFPDVSLVLKGGIVIYIEFKRVGTPSQIVVSDSQKEIHQKLKNLGYTVYLINNPVYFQDVVMQDVLNNLKHN